MKKVHEEILLKNKECSKLSLLSKYPNDKLEFKRVIYQNNNKNIICHEIYCDETLLEVIVYFGFNVNNNAKIFLDFLRNYFLLHTNGYIMQFSELPTDFISIFKENGLALNQQHCLYRNKTVFIKTENK